jgi:hypothetical protein
MAGGIDWFRWHHGSVTDPKFQLVAKKAGVRLGDVIAVWAFVLEKASADANRGTIGPIDFETLDFLLGTEEGTAARILDAMTGRGLIVGSKVAKWDERQAKREREDDSAAERKRQQREREAAVRQGAPASTTGEHVTPSHATSHQEKPREEESRDGEVPRLGVQAPPVRLGQGVAHVDAQGAGRRGEQAGADPANLCAGGGGMSLSQLRAIRRSGQRPSGQIMLVVGKAYPGYDSYPTEVVIDRDVSEFDLRPLSGLAVNVIELRSDVPLTARVLEELRQVKAEVLGFATEAGEVGLNPEHEALLRRYRSTLCASC